MRIGVVGGKQLTQAGQIVRRAEVAESAGDVDGGRMQLSFHVDEGR